MNDDDDIFHPEVRKFHMHIFDDESYVNYSDFLRLKYLYSELKELYEQEKNKSKENPPGPDSAADSPISDV